MLLASRLNSHDMFKFVFCSSRVLGVHAWCRQLTKPEVKEIADIMLKDVSPRSFFFTRSA